MGERVRLKASLLSNGTVGHAADLLSANGVGAVVAAGANAADGVNFALRSFGAGAPGAIIGGVNYGAIITGGGELFPLLLYGGGHSSFDQLHR